MSKQFSLEFTYAYGKPTEKALFRSENEDFIVEEILGFDLVGEGEHLYIHIKKSGENTSWIAEKLADYFEVRDFDVSYSGKKDRHAVTTQWFSIYLPKFSEEVDWLDFVVRYSLNCEILSATRHTQKLRRGMHKANRFCITLRDFCLSTEGESRLSKIAETGVPNYFGEQRFGREGNNLLWADRWFCDGDEVRNRNKRGMVMSAARSYLFNLIVSERVQQNNWNIAIDGDLDTEQTGITAPMWGRGRSATDGKALEIERSVLSNYAVWCDKLEHLGLNQERRDIQLSPQNFTWEQESNMLILRFELPTGTFATSVLRELCILDNQKGLSESV